MVKRGTTNEHLHNLIVFLEKTAQRNKAPIWKSAAYLLSRPTRQRVEVNLYKLNQSAAPMILVPGKVLSKGQLTRKVTVAAFAFSVQAKVKITATGGKALTIRELTTLAPTGKGVAIIV